MLCKTLLVLLALCLSVSQSLLIAGSFDKQFEIIKKTASKEQLYALLYDLPKDKAAIRQAVLKALSHWDASHPRREPYA